MSAEMYTDRPIVHEGETKILPGGTTISVQREANSPASSATFESPQSPTSQVLRPGETVRIPGVGTVSVERQPASHNAQHTPDKYMVHPGETITLPDGGSFTVQRTTTQQQYSPAESTIIRPGETRNIPGVGIVSIESSPVSPTTQGKITIRPGETVELPTGGTISVNSSPSTPHLGKTIISPGETRNIPGVGTISVERQSMGTPTAHGTTVIRPGETVNLPGGGRISVESSPSTPSSNTTGKTIIRPGETINLPGLGQISIQSSPVMDQRPGKTIIHPGETVNLPGYGTISVETSPTNTTSSYNPSSNQFKIQPGESVILPDGTTFTMAPRKLTYDETNYTPGQSEALYVGETRRIPGVGTISVSRVSNNDSKQPISPTVNKTNPPTFNINSSVVSNTDSSSSRPGPTSPTTAPTFNINSSVVSPTKVNSPVAVQPSSPLVTSAKTQDIDFSDMPVFDINQLSALEIHSKPIEGEPQPQGEEEDIPELSFAEKMKMFSAAKNQAKLAPAASSQTQTKQNPPPTALKPAPPTVQAKPETAPKPPKTNPKPIISVTQEPDFPDFDMSPPSSMIDFDLPPPPPDFIFDDFMTPPKKVSLQDKLKELESRYEIEDQSTSSVSTVGTNQVVMSKSDPKFAVKFQ